jgi:hypothetical protein
MKIGKETVKGLTPKSTAGGIRYYWEPTPKERRAGWKTMTLGGDLAAAITAARKRNEEIDTWKAGGAKPRQITRYVKAQTFGAVLTRYEKEKLSKVAPSTARVDMTQLNRLREWAGDQPVRWITRQRVKALRDALCPGGAGTPGHNVAFKLLSMGRKVFAWYIDEDEPGLTNPFERFNLGTPEPRHHIWEPDDIAAFCRAADELGWHSIGFALRLATYNGQREMDILRLTKNDWKEITLRQLRFDQAVYDQLKSDIGPDAGKVMGIRVQQSKTKVWVVAPIEGDMRLEIEAAIAAADARMKAESNLAAAMIVTHDKGARPWGQRDFIARFNEVRAHAIATAEREGNFELAERLRVLQFRDARRTCVVIIGELGLDDAGISAITGHKLATIKQILETYMPRTEAMAARAVVARIAPPTAKDEKKEQEA